MIRVLKNQNIVDVNEKFELLNSFEEILNLDEDSYKKKRKLILKTIQKNLKNGINFFCYERVLNINEPWNKKIIFLKRLKIIFLNLGYNFKISIFIRNQSEILSSAYKQGYLQIIFKNIKYLLFRNYVSSVKNNPDKILLNNLNYFNNLKRISKIVSRENIFLGIFEEFRINKSRQIIKVLKFCGFESFNLDLLSKKKFNDSKNKEFIKLIKKRLYQIVINKRKINFQTFLNFIEIFIKMLFLQKTLNKFVKINTHQEKEIKQIFKISNINLKKKF